MSETRLHTVLRSDEVPPERRSGVDRRGGGDRRALDLWRQMGRPGFDNRAGVERRSGQDRRHGERDRARPEAMPPRPEVVTPWQITDLAPG